MIPNVIAMITITASPTAAAPAASESPGWAPASPDLAGMLGQFFMLALVFAGVVALAYYCTRWLAAAKQSRKGGNLSPLESMSLGQQSAVQIIRAGNKFFLIGITKEHVTLLSELDGDSLTFPEAKSISPNGPVTFTSAFETQLRKYFHKERQQETTSGSHRQASENGQVQKQAQGQNHHSENDTIKDKQ